MDERIRGVHCALLGDVLPSEKRTLRQLFGGRGKKERLGGLEGRLDGNVWLFHGREGGNLSK